MNSRLLLIVVAVVLIAVGAGWMLSQQDAEAPVNKAPASTTSSPAKATTQSTSVKDMRLGNPMAQVQVIEYASFTCPHCASFHNNAFEQLKENYIDTGKISFVFREVYFDQFGLVASMLGRCSGKTEDYFNYIDTLFSTQQQWMASRDGNTILNELVTMGKATGLTDQQVEACLGDKEKSGQLIGWYQQNAKSDGIRSTPSFMVNGKLLSNMSFEEFAKVLDKELGL
ncbi:DsbA family protein [Alteromonas lipolytica]|uniref:Thioredoxin domain-containing protein n=1 Tax=Alteromonas lipolytica TaxID=1856405 RepID=A0A1E8FGT8_9ALTE|nr:DsbA family protein [Alteromonas lipolytica]OFI34956.1 hypothetical protein BFC17_15435 [Alteromonas lipolytica]GGF55366.1 thiol-disulfide oxidoreductase [Alteromonas lipolytica]